MNRFFVELLSFECSGTEAMVFYVQVFLVGRAPGLTPARRSKYAPKGNKKKQIYIP